MLNPITELLRRIATRRSSVTGGGLLSVTYLSLENKVTQAILHNPLVIKVQPKGVEPLTF